MNPEIKAAWVADLRAHPELQGQEVLCRGGKFCCLGRLTDLYVQATGAQWEETEKGFCLLDGEYQELPTVVQEWAGLCSPNPVMALSPAMKQALWTDGWPETLSLINDSGMTFVQIAVLIEEQL